MDRNSIRNKVAEVIIECDIKSFPIDCFQVLQHYGYKVYTYSELQEKNKELYEMCISYSEDAFRNGNLKLIAYNDKMPVKRIRFSLMHELGHHILVHKNDLPQNETEANYFASNILAPRIAIYYAKCKYRKDIEEIFNVSSAASYYIAQDFIVWCNEVCCDGKHDYDLDLYEHFYNPIYKGFVYSTKTCQFCGADVYNEKKPYCTGGCKVTSEEQLNSRRLCHNLTSDDMQALRRFEHNRLYNF